MKKIKIALAAGFVFILLFVSCSKSEIGDFQNNRPEPEYRLFSLLDDYPALYDCFDNGLDQSLFNEYMASAINDNMEEAVNFMRLNKALIEMNIENENHPLSSCITLLKQMMLRVLAQDERDSDDNPLYYIESRNDYNDRSVYYLQDFFSYSDRLKNSDSDTSDAVTAILRKSISYLEDVHGDELEEIMADIVDDLRDTEGTSIRSLLSLMQETAGKLMIRANDDIWLDSENNVIKNSDRTNGLNTGLGNSVRGMNALLSGVNDIISKDSEAKDLLYDIIREAGDLMSAENNGKEMKDVLKELICNIESNYTQGGIKYEENYNSYFHQDNENIYVDSELRNSVKEAWPSIARMFIKAGRPGSMIMDKPTNPADDDFNKTFSNYRGSYVDYLITAMDKMNIDLKPFDLDNSLLRMMQYDCNGKLRTEPGSSGMSILEYVLVAMPVTNLFGYHDCGDANDGASNYGHGHGKMNFGSVTMSDSLFNQAGSSSLGKTSYDLTMKPVHGQRVFRSSRPFTSENADDHRFYMHPSMHINACMATYCVGDGGIPNGGEGVIPKNIEITDWSQLKQLKEDGKIKDVSGTYYPQNYTGMGTFNTGTETAGVIVRCTWEGEGPYYATEKGKVEGDVYTYYRPNGAVYCRVKKPDPTDSSTWIYEYPVDRENSPIDAEDLDLDENGNPIKGRVTGGPERANRYKEKWYSDYYILKGRRKKKILGHEDCYCLPGDNNTYSTDEIVKAKRFEYHETIPENSPKRECATQEEALFRNYQWAMYEKKLVHIMPLIMEDAKILGTMFMRSEANGCVGLANSRRHPGDNGNGRWRLDGSTANTSNGKCEAANSPNSETGFLESRYPGDSKITIDMWTNLIMTSDKAYSALGKGCAMPDQIGVSFRPIARLAFINDKTVMADDAGPDGPYWEKRNRLLPVLIAMLGTLHERNYYEMPDDPNDHDFNSQNIKMPLVYMMDKVLPAFVKPLFYYQKSSDNSPDECWKPRLYGDKNYLEPAAKTFARYLEPGIDKAEAYEKARGNYFELMRVMQSPAADEEDVSDDEPPIRTIVSYLVESKYRASDGILPLMTKTKLTKKLLIFMQHIASREGMYASNENSDSLDYTTWGTRDKLMYGLEQIVTAISSSGGVMNERKYQNFLHPSWIFSKGMRDDNVLLDTLLDEIIGCENNDPESNDPGKGKGLAAFINNPDDKDWINFNRLIKGFGALGAKDGDYSVIENLISVLDEKFNSCTPSDKELRAMRQSAAMILTCYNRETQTWEKPGELTEILCDHLPEILEVFKGNYKDLLVIGRSLAGNDMFVEYFLKNFKSTYPSDDLYSEFCDFLNLDIIKKHDSALWLDLAKLMGDVADMMEENLDNEGASSRSGGFSPVLNIISNESEIDYYGELGNVMRK